jgi:hypothetical protein
VHAACTTLEVPSKSPAIKNKSVFTGCAPIFLHARRIVALWRPVDRGRGRRACLDTVYPEIPRVANTFTQSLKQRAPHFRSAMLNERAKRISAEISRRRPIASAVQRPCLNAFRLPFGAPGEGPPCIRHLPFAIAGDRQGFPLRVLAPQRLARCLSKCMGFSSPHARTRGNTYLATVTC